MQFTLSYVRRVIAVNNLANDILIKVNDTQQVCAKKEVRAILFVPLLIYLNNIAIEVNDIT